MGLTCLDHCQPGSKVPRPTGPPSRLTSSSWPEPCAKGRVSSGESKLFRMSLAMWVVLFLGVGQVSPVVGVAARRPGCSRMWVSGKASGGVDAGLYVGAGGGDRHVLSFVDTVSGNQEPAARRSTVAALCAQAMPCP